MLYELFIFILNFLPKSIAHKILYYKYFKRKLDYKNLIGLNEKIHYLIVNEYGKDEALLSDKYRVKKIINDMNIDGLNIPKTLFIINSLEDYNNISYKSLPDKFIIKCNHGSGNVFVCKKDDKNDIDKKIRILLKDIKKDYSKRSLEYHYKYIKPCIIVEEYLNDNENKVPIDYKFFCFNGKTECVMVCTERDKGYKSTFFNEKWEEINYSTHPSKIKIKRPKNYTKMWEIASKLSKGHKFLRVDLYNIDGRIYFSELTFTPAAGMSRTYTEEANIALGNKLKLGRE